MLDKAICIAAKAHEGQKDKAGKTLYITPASRDVFKEDGDGNDMRSLA